MNLITRLRNLFYETRQPETMPHATTDNTSLYQQLLSALQQACADVPGGKAFLICGNGEFGIRLTWTPEANAPAKRSCHAQTGLLHRGQWQSN